MSTIIRKPFVLSGGGSRGFAHLGVLKAFSEKNIYPEVIAATSAGSIAAAFICDGYTVDEVREIFSKTKLGLSMQWRNWRSGLLSLKKVEDVLHQTLRSKTFEELQLPLHITATNFTTGDQMVFNNGPLVQAILAASSVPMIFPPVNIQGVEYVDGGLSGNLPVEPLREQYTDIIGVHVNPLTPYSPGNSFFANLERTVNLAIRESVLKNKSLCRYFVEPTGLGKFGMFEFGKLEAIYETGLDFTRTLLEKESF